MKKFIPLLFCIFTIVFHPAVSQPLNIKVAIIDNFHFQPFITGSFGRNYLRGINMETEDARKNHGISYSYKVFNYSRVNPLDIYSAVKKVKAWKPDVIVGPRNSNMFLMLKDQFSNILVISPLATADQVYNLSSNYYTLALPNYYIALAMIRYMKKHHPHKSVFGIIESNCSNCVSVAKSFKKLATKNHISYQEKSIDESQLKSASLLKLLKDYPKGSILFLPDTSYFSSVLIVKIVNHLDQKGLTFIGGDSWGSWNNTVIGKMKAKQPYIAYHFTPACYFPNDPIVKSFVRLYKLKTHSNKLPTGDAYLIGYRTFKSISCVLESSHIDTANLQASILQAYKAKLNVNPNWFRPTKYGVFEIAAGQSHRIDIIKAIPTPHYQCVK